MHSNTIFKLSVTQKGQAWKFVDTFKEIMQTCFALQKANVIYYHTYCFIMQNITQQSNIVSVGNGQADWEKNCMLSDINTVMTKMSEKIQ